MGHDDFLVVQPPQAMLQHGAEVCQCESQYYDQAECLKNCCQMRHGEFYTRIMASVIVLICTYIFMAHDIRLFVFCGQSAPQHFLYFFPLPQGHGSFLPGFFSLPGIFTPCFFSSPWLYRLIYLSSSFLSDISTPLSAAPLRRTLPGSHVSGSPALSI